MKVEVQELPNDWKMVNIEFEVETTPPWWQFWKTKIPKQGVTARLFLKTPTPLIWDSLSVTLK